MMMMMTTFKANLISLQCPKHPQTIHNALYIEKESSAVKFDTCCTDNSNSTLLTSLQEISTRNLLPSSTNAVINPHAINEEQYPIQTSPTTHLHVHPVSFCPITIGLDDKPFWLPGVPQQHWQSMCKHITILAWMAHGPCTSTEPAPPPQHDKPLFTLQQNAHSSHSCQVL